MRRSHLVMSWLFMAVIAVTVFSSGATAEKANMDASLLRKTATHVIVATVVRVYEQNETIGDWKYTNYVAEVNIKDVEKGYGPKKDDRLYARYWQRKWMGKNGPAPGTLGYRGLPKEGETLRLYLARNAYDGFGETRDGGFNVIGANGFERLQKTPSIKTDR
jgi:hypothetical protein